jgi:hypothetical protein
VVVKWEKVLKKMAGLQGRDIVDDEGDGGVFRGSCSIDVWGCGASARPRLEAREQLYEFINTSYSTMLRFE